MIRPSPPKRDGHQHHDRALPPLIITTLFLRYHKVILAKPRTHILPRGPTDPASESVSNQTSGSVFCLSNSACPPFALRTATTFSLIAWLRQQASNKRTHLDSCLSSQLRWLSSLVSRQHSHHRAKLWTRDVDSHFRKCIVPGAGVVDSAPMQCQSDSPGRYVTLWRLVRAWTWRTDIWWSPNHDFSVHLGVFVFNLQLTFGSHFGFLFA